MNMDSHVGASEAFYAWKLLMIELSLCFKTLFHLSTPSKGVKGFSPRAAQDRCTRMPNRLTIEDFHGGLFEHRTKQILNQQTGCFDSNGLCQLYN